jgi:hypothetical protein
MKLDASGQSVHEPLRQRSLQGVNPRQNFQSFTTAQPNHRLRQSKRENTVKRNRTLLCHLKV